MKKLIVTACLLTCTAWAEQAICTFSETISTFKCPTNDPGMPYHGEMTPALQLATDGLGSIYACSNAWFGDTECVDYESIGAVTGMGIGSGSLSTLTHTNDSDWFNNRVLLNGIYPPNAEDHGAGFNVATMREVVTFQGGGSDDITLTNLFTIGMAGGNIELRNYGHFQYSITAGTAESPGEQTYGYECYDLQHYTRRPHQENVPRVKPSNTDWYDPLHPYGLVSSNVPGSYATIYTNNGLDLANMTNWVYATTFAHDSNGLATIIVTNWPLPTTAGFFLFETTNAP